MLGLRHNSEACEVLINKLTSVYMRLSCFILAFSLILAYDLLENRRTINVIVTKFFPPCFKVAERFENLDNIFM